MAKLTDKDITKARELRKLGLSWDKIADKLGVTRKGLTDQMKRKHKDLFQGIEFKPKPVKTLEDFAEVVERGISLGKSTKDTLSEYIEQKVAIQNQIVEKHKDLLQDCVSLRDKAKGILDTATLTPEDLKGTVSAFKDIAKIIGDLSKWYDIAGTPASAQIAIDNRSLTLQQGGSGEYDSSGNYIPTATESSQVAISFKIATSAEEYNNAVAEKLESDTTVDAEYTVE